MKVITSVACTSKSVDVSCQTFYECELSHMGILTCIYLNAVSHLGVKSPFCVQHYFVRASLSHGHISSYFFYAA